MRASHTAAAVFYRASVLDAATGREVAVAPRKKNLILDQGLDLVAANKWADCIGYAAAGSDATPTRRDSGAVTFTRAGATVTASAGFFVPADVGRLLKLNSGAELRISAYSSATQVSTTTAGAIAASAGTVWSVEQTALGAEIVRTNNYGTGGGDNAVTLNAAAGTVTQKRTFIFPAETGVVTYREVGWSPSSESGANLFGRDVIPAGGLTLAAGQQLKIVLELVLTVDLLSAPEAANTLPWDGGTAEQQIENVNWEYFFHPSSAESLQIFVGESTAAFSAPAITVSGDAGRELDGTRWTVNATATPYVAGSYERLFSGYFDLNAGNSAALRCAGFGWLYYGTLYAVLRVRFSANQEKTSDESLRLDFRHSWGRVLVN